MLLWIDGFDNYGTGSSIDPTSALSRKYSIAAGTCLLADGRLGGKSIKLTGGPGSVYFGTGAITTNATMIIGFAMKVANFPTAEVFLTLRDGSTTGVQFVLLSSGEIRVQRGSTILGTTTGYSLSIDTWYYMEFKVVCDATTGSVVIRRSGVTIFSMSSINTQAGTHAYHDQFILRGMYSNVAVQYDDMYGADGSGSFNNTFLGNVRAVTLRPDGDGSSTQFTPSSGDNYACVDEEVCNDDTDYVEDGTVGHKDLYTFDDTEFDTIKGVMVCTDCKETDATSYDLITVCKSGATESDDSGQAIGSTDFVTKRRLLETDPNTGALWTPTNLSAAEFGVKVG